MAKRKHTFRAFDPAEFLESAAEAEAYLAAVVEEAGDDPAVILRALGHIARARNVAQLARDAGLTREGVYKALGPSGNPSFATVVKVAGAMGLRVQFAKA